MSDLQTALEEYLALRRTLGYKLSVVGGLLQRFVQYLEEKNTPFITTELAVEWSIQPKCDPSQWACRLGIARRFAQYRSAADPRTQIPPMGLLPHRYHRKPPYIYSDDEIARLIRAAGQLSSPLGLRAATYSTLFGLVSITGMRISEPINLDWEDVDLAQGILTARQSKFGRSRLVPVHPTTQNVLCKYASLRDRIFPRPKTVSFFVSESGRRLTYSALLQTFIRLLHQIGLRGSSNRRRPRIHDLRHGLAIRTLLHWYRAREDVEQRMPVLTTYLGHAQVASTYWYLSATPQLFRLIVGRLDGDKREVPS
jgi:integrase